MAIRKPIRHWRVLIAGVAISIVIVAALFASAVAVVGRASELNDIVYQQCLRDETQDVVIAAQLDAAKARARASLPPGSAVLHQALETLNDGIDALEPADEKPCQPPRGSR